MLFRSADDRAVACSAWSTEASSSLPQEISAHLVHILGPTFRPRAIHVVKELPKTQSGKIVRRLIRQKYLGEELGDLSTVENPGALKLLPTGV